jgi:putative FmdB family regulatory protein
MPIYAYRCEACGFAKDVLQKISDDALTVCPSCGKDSFRKQLTAAGFQLKGSGWYVTDFRAMAVAGQQGQWHRHRRTDAPLRPQKRLLPLRRLRLLRPHRRRLPRGGTVHPSAS